MVEFVANRLGKVKIYKQFKLVIELKTTKKKQQQNTTKGNKIYGNIECHIKVDLLSNITTN